MIKIALCDDNDISLEYYKHLLEKIADSSGLEIKILKFRSGEQLLFSLSDDPNLVDIIYLDILMGKMNGMETARKLRNLGCVSQIIYLTSSEEYVFEAFDVEPFYYIVKDEITKDKFEEIFLRATKLVYERTMDYIILTYGATKMKVHLDRIYYFEVHNRMISVHTMDSTIRFYGSLVEIEKKLEDKNFAKPYRSILVNCNNIKRLLVDKVILMNNVELPVSEKHYQAIQEGFSKCLLQL